MWNGGTVKSEYVSVLWVEFQLVLGVGQSPPAPIVA